MTQQTSFFQRLLATDAGWGTLALRLTAGAIFVAHGAQKLFGWFGGYGLEGTGQWMQSIGLAPGYLMALLAGAAEFFGKGLFVAQNGYEFALALLGVALALAVNGGGRASIDRAMTQAA
jgi:putative oxidoreductase